jgi:hypothetical protein
VHSTSVLCCRTGCAPAVSLLPVVTVSSERARERALSRVSSSVVLLSSERAVFRPCRSGAVQKEVLGTGRACPCRGPASPVRRPSYHSCPCGSRCRTVATGLVQRVLAHNPRLRSHGRGVAVLCCSGGSGAGRSRRSRADSLSTPLVSCRLLPLRFVPDHQRKWIPGGSRT